MSLQANGRYVRHVVVCMCLCTYICVTTDLLRQGKENETKDVIPFAALKLFNRWLKLFHFEIDSVESIFKILSKTNCLNSISTCHLVYRFCMWLYQVFCGRAPETSKYKFFCMYLYDSTSCYHQGTSFHCSPFLLSPHPKIVLVNKMVIILYNFDYNDKNNCEGNERRKRSVSFVTPIQNAMGFFGCFCK